MAASLITFKPRTSGPAWYTSGKPCFFQNRDECPPESRNLAQLLVPGAVLPYTFADLSSCQVLRERLQTKHLSKVWYPRFGRELSTRLHPTEACLGLRKLEVLNTCGESGTDQGVTPPAMLQGFARSDADEKPVPWEIALQSSVVQKALDGNQVRVLAKERRLQPQVNGMKDKDWHDFDFMRNFEGSLGVGIGFTDIEVATSKTAIVHNDLPAIPFEVLPSPFAAVGPVVHPAQVLGLIMAKPNAFVEGLAPAVNARILSVNATLSAEAICKAALEGQPGDIMLIEHQVMQQKSFSDSSCQSAGSYKPLPIEAIPEVFRAIQMAIDAGMIAIEPLGNQNDCCSADGLCGLNLDDQKYFGDRFLFRSGEPDFDSGAIWVAGLNKDKTPARLANRSQKADTASVADGLKTTTPALTWGQQQLCTGEDVGYGESMPFGLESPATEDDWLDDPAPLEDEWTLDVTASTRSASARLPLCSGYSWFEGTSAAGAVIAAATATVQGIYQAHYGRRLGPDEMRLLVRRYSQRSAWNLKKLMLSEPEFLALVVPYVRGIYRDVWGADPSRDKILDSLRYLNQPANEGFEGLRRIFIDEQASMFSELGSFLMSKGSASL